MTSPSERIERFDCFGSSCSVLVTGSADGRSAHEAALGARQSLEKWHGRFSRFIATSELSQLNADPRQTVPASPLLLALALAVRAAGELSGGLVDATLIDQIERAGYEHDLDEPLSLSLSLGLAPARRPASPDRTANWRKVLVDLDDQTITRPSGVKLDGGGLAKGLFADVLKQRLAGHSCFAIDCAGDLALGGLAGIERSVLVASPFDGRTLHTFQLPDACVATSGIGRRSWLDDNGRPAHHLLDPSTGEPAFTGIVQATALAPTALEAEIRAKSALLAGPRAACAQLPHGGAIVLDDGSHRVLGPPVSVTADQLAAFA